MQSMHMVNSFDPSQPNDLPPADRVLMARRNKVLGASYRLFYQTPVHLVRGDGALLFDGEGRDYLDAYNNVPVVGHSNREVQQRVNAQLGALNTHTRYLTDAIVNYAERLTALFPEPLDQVVFACSGSEAVDLALRVSKHVTGRQGIIATKHAYHGTTQASAQVSPSLGVNNEIPDFVVLIDAPDQLRDGSDSGAAFGARVQAGIDELRRRGHEPAALLLDSILSSDGLQVGPLGLLASAVSAIRAAGGIYIADEVQPGFGRAGTWWGFTRHSVQPDLVVLGKPMANGLPLSALVGRADLLDAFGHDVRYFNTFGGSQVTIAAAAAVLDELTDRDLINAAAIVGTEISGELNHVVDMDPTASVRHAGLFLAVEVISDTDSLSPDAARARAIVEHMRTQRVLISASGTYDNVLKIRPPLVFGHEHVPRLIEAFGNAWISTRP